MASRFYRPELDALRFCAFLAVFAHHLQLPQPHWNLLRMMGAYGVSIFFLLSAYLIVELLIREREATGATHLKAFAVRRILRIWPVYFAALVVFFALGRVVPFLFLPVKATLAFLFMVGNVWEARHGWLRSPASSLWSVSVEEQFYLLIPTLFAFGGTRALLIAVPFIVAAAYAALAYFGLHGVNPHLEVWANSFVQFQFFAAGTACAILLHGRQWLVSRSARIALLLSGLLAWFVSVRFFGLEADLPTTAARLLAGYPLLLGGTLAIFLAVFNCTLRIPSWLRYLGKISYGLYVFHYLWLSVVFGPALRRFTYFHTRSLRGAVAALLATIATAAVSYTFFEKPILRIKDRFEFIRTRRI